MKFRYNNRASAVGDALNIKAVPTPRGSPWSPEQCAIVVTYLSLPFLKHQYTHESLLTDKFRSAVYEEIVAREVLGRKRNKLTRAVRNLSETKK